LPCSFFSEGLAIKILCITALRSVTVEDAKISARTSIVPALRRVIRPAIEAEIRKHQKEGRTVAILTGSLEPLVKPFCEEMGCLCIGTQPETDPTGTYYTGHLAARPNITAEKVRHVESTGHALNELYGYGNSKNDIPFMSKTGNPHIVNPGLSPVCLSPRTAHTAADRVLRRHSTQHGWIDTFAAPHK
jgi:HAD superfamily phosphoserine phosphatase-like hydrolase